MSLNFKNKLLNNKKYKTRSKIRIKRTKNEDEEDINTIIENNLKLS
jgi:hypothetical protein